MRWLIIFILLLSACTTQSIDSVTSRAVVQTAEPNPDPLIESDVYVVVVRDGSLFYEDAKRFANHKDASIIFYTRNVKESLAQLQTLQPDFVSFVLEPTYEYTAVDALMRSLDDDFYVDAAYGVLTGSDLPTFRKYVDELMSKQVTPQVACEKTTGENVIVSPLPCVESMKPPLDMPYAGESLKQFKNRILFTTKLENVDDGTKDYLISQASSWVLLGDPQTNTSSTSHCMKSYKNDPFPDGARRVEVELDGSNHFHYSNVQQSEHGVSITHEPLCMFSIPKGNSTTLKFLTKELFVEDLGDEYLLSLPTTDVELPIRIAFKLE